MESLAACATWRILFKMLGIRETRSDVDTGPNGRRIRNRAAEFLALRRRHRSKSSTSAAPHDESQRNVWSLRSVPARDAIRRSGTSLPVLHRSRGCRSNGGYLLVGIELTTTVNFTREVSDSMGDYLTFRRICVETLTS